MEGQACHGAYMRTRVMARTHWGLSDLPSKQAPPVQGLREPKEAGRSTGGQQGPSQKHLGYSLREGNPRQGRTSCGKTGREAGLKGALGLGDRAMWSLNGAPESRISGSGNHCRAGEHRGGGV